MGRDHRKVRAQPIETGEGPGQGAQAGATGATGGTCGTGIGASRTG